MIVAKIINFLLRFEAFRKLRDSLVGKLADSSIAENNKIWEQRLQAREEDFKRERERDRLEDKIKFESYKAESEKLLEEKENRLAQRENELKIEIKKANDSIEQAVYAENIYAETMFEMKKLQYDAKKALENVTELAKITGRIDEFFERIESPRHKEQTAIDGKIAILEKERHNRKKA